MSVTAASLTAAASQGAFPATISAIAAGSNLQLRWHAQGKLQRGSAMALAVAGWQPAADDLVLVIRGDDDRLFVLGPLGPARQPEPPAQQPERPTSDTLQLSAGAVAECAAADGELRVRGRDGRLLFRFSPEQGTLQLEQQGMDIAISARNLRFNAEQDIHLAARQVHLEGLEAVRASVKKAGRDVAGASSLHLEQGRIGLESGHLALRARTALASIGDMQWVGQIWRGTVDRASLTARRLETASDVVVQTAQDVFQRVRGLHQLTAERTRQIVSGTMQVKAKKVLYRAAEAFKVRADKIHLG